MHSVVKIPILRPGTTKRAPPTWLANLSGSYLCNLWLKRIEWIDSGKLYSVHSVHSVVIIPILKPVTTKRAPPTWFASLSGSYLCNLWLIRFERIGCCMPRHSAQLEVKFSGISGGSQLPCRKPHACCPWRSGCASEADVALLWSRRASTFARISSNGFTTLPGRRFFTPRCRFSASARRPFNVRGT